MVKALQLRASAGGLRIPATPRSESEWSWTFRNALSDPFPEKAREFIVKCVSRAQGEPNVTHLLAAALTHVSVFAYIATTNFDEQALGGFWSLPRDSYVEPHVIYDPVAHSETSAKIARNVPIIVKAHGHHTTYGLGIIDAQTNTLLLM
jgi:hypothetical protein